MTQRLEDARIVVTRAVGVQDRLAQQLAAEGAQVLSFPALEIVPLDASPPAGEFDCALFASPMAVRYGLPRIAGRLPETLFAPGEGTRTALAEAGAGDAIVPATGAGLEALLATLAPETLAGRRVLFVCGRPLNRRSRHALAARGAEVTPFAVYVRRAVTDPGPLADWIRVGGADVIMASSAAAVAAVAGLPGTGATGLDWIVSSGRVARAVERAGARTAAVAASAGAADMTAAAIRWWQSEGGRNGT